ncbi:hypothetical protein [Gordonia sihwensis]|uniref:hypothetical protein n=1 Tax=Gordonia sihwensis TaxID=173559 RepID=UPI003D9528EA
MTYPSPPTKRGPLLPILITTVVVLVVALVVAVVLVVMNDGDRDDSASPAAATSTETADAPQTAPAATTTAEPEPQAPVVGAYVGAGGPRPAGAEPLPTYTGRYTKLLSAHLLTPTGGIGCDFNAADQDGRQGQCGVRSMNTTSSPLGTEVIGGTRKGKWLFQLSGNKVGAPTGNSGTTGWMNAPGEGYTVPRVEYGKQYYFEDWAIASEVNGLTVWNVTTGSGVFLSNEKVETFDGPGPATATATAEDVVLGSMPSNGKGYGTSRPTEVYAGGSPTSRITNITWSSWGGDRAEGTGTGTYRVDGRVGREQYIPATVVASNIGMCNGKRAYLTIAWYFPSKGETASAGREMKTCWDR